MLPGVLYQIARLQVDEGQLARVQFNVEAVLFPEDLELSYITFLKPKQRTLALHRMSVFEASVSPVYTTQIACGNSA